MTAVLDRSSVAVYDRAFAAAASLEYPTVDAFEARMGYQIDRARLEAAARVLACPLKVHPPHWQHGRVLYAAVRQYLATCGSRPLCLDIGTAKGFSALCLRWALQDAGVADGIVVSVDVVDPCARVSRNTVAELEGLQTLTDLLAPWPEAAWIHFRQSTGIAWLEAYEGRVEVAFVDGKHQETVVRQEGALLAARQRAGDLVLFDDLQIPGVAAAVASLGDLYAFETLEAGPRRYAIGRRR